MMGKEKGEASMILLALKMGNGLCFFLGGKGKREGSGFLYLLKGEKRGGGAACGK